MLETHRYELKLQHEDSKLSVLFKRFKLLYYIFTLVSLLKKSKNSYYPYIYYITSIFVYNRATKVGQRECKSLIRNKKFISYFFDRKHMNKFPNRNYGKYQPPVKFPSLFYFSEL